MLRLITLMLLICVTFTSALGNANEPSNSFASDYVGTWQAKMAGTPVEIALWETGQRTAFTGIVRTLDGDCALSFNQHLNPRILQGKAIAKGDFWRHFSSIRISAAKPLTPKPNNQADWKQWITHSEHCRFKKIPGFYKLFKDLKTNKMQLSEEKRGSTRSLGPQNVSRSKATAEMLVMVKNLKPQPTPQELQAIQDPTFSLQSSASRISQCYQQYLVGQYRLAMIDIDTVSATPISDAAVLVKTRDFNVYEMKDREQAYQKSTTIDWPNLLLDNNHVGDTSAYCARATAFNAFADALASQSLVKADQGSGAQGDFKIVETPDNQYLVDRFGVGKIRLLGKNTSANGEVIRQFGKTNAFGPGDVTHKMSWDQKSGRFRSRPFAKNSVTGASVIDVFVAQQSAQFQLDQAVTDQYEVDVFKFVWGKVDEPVCIKWKGKLNIATCVDERPMKDRLTYTVLVRDLDVAKAIFKTLSEDPASWVGETGASCPSGPLCEYGQHAYLQNLFDRNVSALRKTEKEILFAGIIEQGNRMNKFLKLAPGETVHASAIPFLINEYMHDYKNRPAQCLEAGAIEATFKDRTPDIVFQNGFGTEVDRMSGIDREGFYRINKEFEQACRDLCGVRGPQAWQLMINQGFNGNSLLAELTSRMHDFSRDHDCRSDVVKAFEASLLAMYDQSKMNVAKDALIERSSY